MPSDQAKIGRRRGMPTPNSTELLERAGMKRPGSHPELGEEQPGGREPAPGRLRIVQAFVNTNDIEGGTDEFSTPNALASWFRTSGLVRSPVRVGMNDPARAVELREALRALLLANNAGKLDRRAQQVLDQAAIAARFTVRFGSRQPQATLEPTA